MKYAKQLSQLCTPAFFYFAISAFVYVLAILQNVGKKDGEFCLGALSCTVPSTVLVFVIKALYVVFWTWVLNLMCKDGYPNIAWVMVLLPFIAMFLGMLFLNKKRENMASHSPLRNIASDLLKDKNTHRYNRKNKND